MLKQVPNIITSLNLLCGCIAIFFAVSGDLVIAAFFVLTGIFFDFFDGLAARLLNAQSAIGLQLDSLADMVTSGVAPGIVMVQLLHLSYRGDALDVSTTFFTESWNQDSLSYVPFIGLLLTVAAAYRLAKFNVDTRQTTSFIGVPTPAITLLVLSFPLILTYQYSERVEDILLHPWFLILVTLVSCVLLNSEIRLFALKFKTWDFKSNAVRYVFLMGCIMALVLLKFIAIPVILVWYILLSVFWKTEK